MVSYVNSTTSTFDANLPGSTNTTFTLATTALLPGEYITCVEMRIYFFASNP